MKKICLAAIALLLLSGCARPEVEFEASLDAAMRKAKREGKHLLIDFSSPGWIPCRLLVQQFFSHPDYARYLTGHYVLYHADSAEESGQAVFEKYDVNATPCVLVGLPDGSEVDRIIGYDVPAEEYREILDRVRRGENTLHNLLKAFERQPEDPAIAANLARKYQERFVFSKMHSYSEIVLGNPESARKVMLQSSQ